MRRVLVDVSAYTFMVTKSAQPKLDEKGAQKFARITSEPMWQVEVLALDKENEGGETVNVGVAGVKPEASVGQVVNLPGLVAIPWQNNNRSGLAFKADTVMVLAGGSV